MTTAHALILAGAALFVGLAIGGYIGYWLGKPFELVGVDS